MGKYQHEKMNLETSVKEQGMKQQGKMKTTNVNQR